MDYKEIRGLSEYFQERKENLTRIIYHLDRFARFSLLFASLMTVSFVAGNFIRTHYGDSTEINQVTSYDEKAEMRKYSKLIKIIENKEDFHNLKIRCIQK